VCLYFGTIEGVGWGVKMQCNIQRVLCLYLAVVTKRNTLMFSAWCQSVLL